MLPQIMDDVPRLIEQASQQASQQQYQQRQPMVILLRPSSWDAATFDWSDFPIVQRDAFVASASASASPSSSCCCEQQDENDDPKNQQQQALCIQQQQQQQQVEDRDWISTCSSDSDLSCCSSTALSTSVEEEEEEEDNVVSSSAKSSRRRRVSFSATKHVRTHSIVLGDHPCCAQLALELGWDHDDGQTIGMLDQSAATAIASRKKQLRRRSYFERKVLLKEVGGMTDEDIRVTTLRHAAPSTRDLSVMQGICI